MERAIREVPTTSQQHPFEYSFSMKAQEDKMLPYFYVLVKRKLFPRDTAY
jgi:hypothetical protein